MSSLPRKYKTVILVIFILLFGSIAAYTLLHTKAITATWLSGSSGPTASNGSFATWRGEQLGIAGTWADNVYVQPNPPQCTSEYGSWTKSLDIAIGAIFSGESWSAAASGTYDARWSQSLTNLRDKCANHMQTVYIRFAHEMNGSWYPWKVTTADKDNFIVAWKRFRNLQKSLFPAGKLVFCVNRESVSSGFDWRQSVPGYSDGTTSQWIDVGCVDYYNQYPAAKTQAEFDSIILQNDGYGAPKGLEKHRQFWGSQGLPLGIGEWNNNADSSQAGDAPAFMTAMYNYFSSYGGTGAGNVLYEILYNAQDSGQPQFWIYENTNMPNAAAAYKNLVWPNSTTSPSSTQPDLIITAISMNPASPKVGQAVTFSAVIKNQGTGSIPAGTTISAAFSVDGNKVSWSDTYSNALAAGASVTLTANSGPSGSATWTPTAAGTYQVMAYVDDSNRIASESSENNNTLSTNISVTTGTITDTTPPSAPTNLTASAINTNQINLGWAASSDDVGVTGYEVYRNNSKVATINTTNYGDTGLIANTSYNYFIKALDAANNASVASATASATTQSSPPIVASGNLAGKLLDSSGTVPRKARISLSFSGATHTYSTTKTGNYSISNIPAGTYQVTYSGLKLKSQTMTVTITGGQTTIKDVILMK
jgi:hypothetical protein